jgi:hypothetical protein
MAKGAYRHQRMALVWGRHPRGGQGAAWRPWAGWRRPGGSAARRHDAHVVLKEEIDDQTGEEAEALLREPYPDHQPPPRCPGGTL